MKHLVQTFSLLVGFIFLQIVALSLVTWSLPNQISFPFFENAGFYFQLALSNPAAALELVFVQQPMLVVEKMDIASNNQVWGIYTMPITTVTLLLLAIFTSWMSPFKQLNINSALFSSGMILIIISVYYLRVASCCTSSPSWLGEVLLLSMIFNPTVDNAFWQDVYLLLTPWLYMLQLLTFIIAITCLYFSCHRLNSKSV